MDETTFLTEEQAAEFEADFTALRQIISDLHCSGSSDKLLKKLDEAFTGLWKAVFSTPVPEQPMPRAEDSIET
ncbi:hypothetical protein OAC22_01040 [bacterium]|nr:hypothetical protein [bacterium]